MASKSMLPVNVLKMMLPGQRLISSLLCTLLMMTPVFMVGPGLLINIALQRALTACELPC